jgi:hypothetical protein
MEIAQALHEAVWIGKIKLEATFTWEHLAQFVDLRILINNVHFENDLEDYCLEAHCQYSAASAYKFQFLGLDHYDMNTIVWKACPLFNQSRKRPITVRIWELLEERLGL